jgi:hypothetical protein
VTSERAAEFAYDPTLFACSDPEHGCTRVLCECPWFDGCCHSCPDRLSELPACMETWEEQPW